MPFVCVLKRFVIMSSFFENIRPCWLREICIRQRLAVISCPMASSSTLIRNFSAHEQNMSLHTPANPSLVAMRKSLSRHTWMSFEKFAPCFMTICWLTIKKINLSFLIKRRKHGSLFACILQNLGIRSTFWRPKH